MYRAPRGGGKDWCRLFWRAAKKMVLSCVGPFECAERHDVLAAEAQCRGRGRIALWVSSARQPRQMNVVACCLDRCGRDGGAGGAGGELSCLSLAPRSTSADLRNLNSTAIPQTPRIEPRLPRFRARTHSGTYLYMPAPPEPAARTSRSPWAPARASSHGLVQQAAKLSRQPRGLDDTAQAARVALIFAS